MTIKILIVEDHELTRQGLRYTLGQQSDIEIAGEVDNGLKAISLAEETQPNLVLMDIGLPVMDGITATQHIKKSHPHIKVVVLTSHQEENHVIAAISAGADGYCMKDIKMERLLQVLQMVADGGIWLDPAIAETLMHNLPHSTSDQTVESSPAKRQRFNTELTDRELDVLKEIVAGKSNKEIAQSLEISLHTVKSHVCNIIQKLAVDDRTQAAVKALQTGLV